MKINIKLTFVLIIVICTCTVTAIDVERRGKASRALALKQKPKVVKEYFIGKNLYFSMSDLSIYIVKEHHAHVFHKTLDGKEKFIGSANDIATKHPQLTYTLGLEHMVPKSMRANHCKFFENIKKDIENGGYQNTNPCSIEYKKVVEGTKLSCKNFKWKNLSEMLKYKEKYSEILSVFRHAYCWKAVQKYENRVLTAVAIATPVLTTTVDVCQAVVGVLDEAVTGGYISAVYSSATNGIRDGSIQILGPKLPDGKKKRLLLTHGIVLIVDLATAPITVEGLGKNIVLDLAKGLTKLAITTVSDIIGAKGDKKKIAKIQEKLVIDIAKTVSMSIATGIIGDVANHGLAKGDNSNKIGQAIAQGINVLIHKIYDADFLTSSNQKSNKFIELRSNAIVKDH